MIQQKENQTSQLPQNNLPTPHVLVRSFANERIYDDNNDILLLYQPLHQVQHSTGLPVLVQSLANERIYNDDDILSQLVQQNGLWCNSSHQDDILELSQEMTYMGIEHN